MEKIYTYEEKIVARIYLIYIDYIPHIKVRNMRRY